MRLLQSSTRILGAIVRMEDDVGKLAIAGVDIVIMTLICVTLFSGRPAFETSRATADRPAPAALAPLR